MTDNIVTPTGTMTYSTVAPAHHPPTSAARMRRLRERRRKGLRCCIALPIRETEIDALIARGLLAPTDRDDPFEISRALGRLLDATL